MESPQVQQDRSLSFRLGSLLGSRALGIALLFAAVYLAFPTRQYYWDGISFSIDIEHAQSWRDLFNVHHLLYNHIGYLEYKWSGGGRRVLYLLQWTNCLFGALLIAATYRLLRAMKLPGSNSAAAAAILGASATFWKFTTDADSYILANFCLVLAYLALPRSPVRGGLFHFGAMLMHQLSALFYPAGLALLWRQSRERFWRDAAVYTAISAGGTLPAYVLAYRLAPARQTAPSLLGWLTFHADVPFSFHVLDNAKWLLLGTGRLFVGGKLSASAFVAGPAALFLGGLAVRSYRAVGKKLIRPKESLPLVIWAGIYLAFLFVWEPYNTFYRLFYLVPLVALFALAARHAPARPLALLAAALACWNFAQFIYPNTQIENNAPLAAALKHQREWPPGTGVIYGKFVPDLWTISYFNPQVSWIAMERTDPERVHKLATEFARGGARIYLDWTYLANSGEPAERFTFRAVSPGRQQ